MVSTHTHEVMVVRGRAAETVEKRIITQQVIMSRAQVQIANVRRKGRMTSKKMSPVFRIEGINWVDELNEKKKKLQSL